METISKRDSIYAVGVIGMNGLVNVITHAIVYLDLAFVCLLFAVGLYKRINDKGPALKIAQQERQKEEMGEFVQNVSSEAGLGEICTK
jgi:hypothetical protein